MLIIFKRIFADRALFFKLLVASLLVNLLALATPIYVIQVLQRYIAYGVISTLITLFFGILFIVIFEFFFKNIRHRMARQYELSNVAYTNQILNRLCTYLPKKEGQNRSHVENTSKSSLLFDIDTVMSGKWTQAT